MNFLFKKAATLLLIMALLFVTVLLSGCAPNYVDGVYRVEFSTYDSLGFKEYIDATVLDGEIIAIEINGIDKNGVTKTDNSEYSIAMELATGTTPDKVYETLNNRYLLLAADKESEESVDAVAGATLTSTNYELLFAALAEAVISGETLTYIDLPPGN